MMSVALLPGTKYAPMAAIAIVLLLIGSSAAVDNSPEGGNITPNDEFPVISVNGTPTIDPSAYRLVVDGTVQNVLSFTLDDVRAMPAVSEVLTLRSVSGPEGRANFTGVPLRTILDMAVLNASSQKVAFFSADGYSTDLTIDEARLGDVLVCYEMNGEPLPPQQGFPVRMVVPDHWGYKWAKWVTHIEVVDHDFKGYWESRGWSDNAWITPQSDWLYHAVLLTAAGIAGGLAGASGMVNGWRRLNGGKYLVDPRVHAYAGYAFAILSIVVLVWWVAQTYAYRGAVGYTYHGRLAIPAVALEAIGLVTGVLLVKRRSKVRWLHTLATVGGFALFLLTVILGIQLAML
jgi:DMSO/TMAO reductase YedYZ molybdopterin-dependent catalytic subunit